MSNQSSTPVYRGRIKHQHWYRDNQVYFLTARCHQRRPAFRSEGAKAIFWDRFEHYTHHHTFTPWVTSLLDNHYHTLGYLRQGVELQPMMRGLHGSVAKLVNDTLDEPMRPFWGGGAGKTYMDGCIRDEKQARAAYQYTLRQAERHKLTTEPHHYPHTHACIDCERAISRARELQAFLTGVRYKRYIH